MVCQFFVKNGYALGHFGLLLGAEMRKRNGFEMKWDWYWLVFVYVQV